MSGIEFDIQARHGGHLHTINVKYGYFILLLSAVHTGLIILQSYSQIKRWRKDGSIGSISPWIKVLLMVGVWMGIFIVLAVWKIKLPEHINVFYKRCGRLSMALIPFNIFLVLRSANPAFNFINYLSQINLHKWISRLIIVFSLIHSFGFLVKWINEGVLVHKLQNNLNLLGLIVGILALGLLFVSLRPLRRKFYKYFYLFHNITVWAFVFLIGFHARPGVFLYCIICFILLAFQIFTRFSDQEPVESPQIIRDNQGSSKLIIVRIPKMYISPWIPGSHIRLQSKSWRQYFFPSHPYTIASTIDDDTLDLIIREKSNFKFQDQNSYYLTGPYPTIPEPFFQTVEKCNIICGGSGISFGLPILKGIRNSGNNAEVTLIWCVRNENDTYILKYLGIEEKIDVYITGQNSTIEQDEVSRGLLGSSNNEDTIDQSFELGNMMPTQNVITPKGRILANVFRGRPKFDNVFENLTYSEDKTNQWLISCGPNELVNSVNKWGKQHQIPCMSEVYEM